MKYILSNKAKDNKLAKQEERWDSLKERLTALRKYQRDTSLIDPFLPLFKPKIQMAKATYSETETSVPV